MLPELRITFSIEPDADRDAQREFWSSATTLEWFKHRGYVLYRSINGTDKIYPMHPPEYGFYRAEYPYACFKCEEIDQLQPLEDDNTRGNIAYAQDVQNRHVVIKVVPAHTEEYHILRFLHAQKSDTLKENCILPVLDLLPVEGYYFAVMPRWGRNITVPYIYNVSEVIPLIRSLLKALAYMHEHNITHGDIGQHNILTNHLYSVENGGNLARLTMRSRGSLLYAIIDFDASVMLPADVDRSKFRLPYHKGFRRYPSIKDMETGPFDYNPFVQDVGAMGAMLCQEFQHLSPRLPLLAPLLDGMTTWELDKRLTASEALQFFNDRVSEIAEEQLGRCDKSEDDSGDYYYDDYDRWKRLSPDFVEKWKAYKARSLPLRIRLLRWLYFKPFFCHIIPMTRLLFYKLFYFPRVLIGMFL